MWLREWVLNKFIERLEEGDKALSGAVARDPIVAGQTSTLANLQLGKDQALIQRGFSLYNNAMANFKVEMVDLISRFQGGSIDKASARAEWKAITAQHYKQLFKAGAMAAGNPFYDELGITKHDAAFMAKARRLEQQFFDGFLDDINNPNHSPTHPYLQRAAYYADTGKSQFYNGMINGFGEDVEIHWVLGMPREAHCEVCPIYAMKVWTWQTIPTVPRAGDTPCLFNCYCDLEFLPRTTATPGMNLRVPGSTSDAAMDSPQRWASAFDEAGQEVFGTTLNQVETLYKQMYKVRQQIHLESNPLARTELIALRKNLNRQLIDYVEARGVRATPAISVSTLLDYADQAAALGGQLFTGAFDGLATGTEVTLLRGNFFTRGVLKRTALGLIVNNGKAAYTLNQSTDILFILRSPSVAESIEEYGVIGMKWGVHKEEEKGSEANPVKPEEFDTYFHGSTVLVLKSIAKNGLLPATDANRMFDKGTYYTGDRADAVFLCQDRESALVWARGTALRAGERSNQQNLGYTYVPTAVVFEVRVPKGSLHADMEAGTGTFFHSGKIAPKNIKGFFVVPKLNGWPDRGQDSFHGATHGKLHEAANGEIFYVPVIIWELVDPLAESINRLKALVEGNAQSGNYGHKGQGTGEVGGSAKRDQGDLAPAASHADLPDYIKALRVPPAWTDLRYNRDPNGDMMVVGKDSKGRDQYLYSAKFSATKAAEKFARIKELDRMESRVTHEILTAIHGRSDNAESAACALLVLRMGIRPGSDDDTGGAVKAYGATTLLGEHVKVVAGDIHLRFIGKKGVAIDLKVEDHFVAKDLERRRNAVGAKGRLFSVTHGQLSGYISKLDGGGFKTKDFRTLMGTSTAREMVAKMKPPRSEKEYKKQVRAVAEAVAKRLGNTPIVALQSYISPTVFAKWRKLWS